MAASSCSGCPFSESQTSQTDSRRTSTTTESAFFDMICILHDDNHGSRSAVRANCQHFLSLRAVSPDSDFNRIICTPDQDTFSYSVLCPTSACQNSHLQRGPLYSIGAVQQCRLGQRWSGGLGTAFPSWLFLRCAAPSTARDIPMRCRHAECHGNSDVRDFLRLFI